MVGAISFRQGQREDAKVLSYTGKGVRDKRRDLRNAKGDGEAIGRAIVAARVVGVGCKDQIISPSHCSWGSVPHAIRSPPVLDTRPYVRRGTRITKSPKPEPRIPIGPVELHGLGLGVGHAKKP